MSVPSTSTSIEDSGEEFQPVPSKKLKTGDYVPLETKIKIVNMTRQHPKWSLQTIHKHGGTALRLKKDLFKWREQIEKGSGIKEKFDQINKWTFDRFVEARRQMQPVSTRIIQQ